MTDILLYPRLPLHHARMLADRYRNLAIEEVGEGDADLSAVLYASTGGSRAGRTHLAGLHDGLIGLARVNGYPSTPPPAFFDAAAAEYLAREMKITPSEAARPEVWAYFGCILLPGVVRWRFPGGAEGTPVERFLGGGRGIRNTFGRLWWRAYSLGEPTRDHPYRLLGLLGEDELVQVMERPVVAGDSRLSRVILNTFLEMASSSPVARSELLREAMKRIRRWLPVFEPAAIDDAALRAHVAEMFAIAGRAVLDRKELVSRSPAIVSETVSGEPAQTDPAATNIAECQRYDGSLWKEIATWGKLTGAIQPFHRKIAYSIGDRIQRDIPPSEKQAAIGVAILRTAREAGYSFPVDSVGT